MVDDRVEADLGQRVAQLGRGMVERPGLAREIGAEIDDRDRVSIGHGFSWHPLVSTVFDPRIASLNASSNDKSGSLQPRCTGVQVGAIFDVRALLTPPLAGQRMVRLSSKGFRAEMLA